MGQRVFSGRLPFGFSFCSFFDGCLYIAEVGEEIVPGSRCDPCLSVDNGFHHRTVAFAPGGGRIITEPELAPLQNDVKLVAVVGHLLVKDIMRRLSLRMFCTTGSGTKLPLMRFFRTHSAIHWASLTSLLRPGNCLMK